jgi:hypothetical protein
MDGWITQIKSKKSTKQEKRYNICKRKEGVRKEKKQKQNR